MEMEVFDENDVLEEIERSFPPPVDIFPKTPSKRTPKKRCYTSIVPKAPQNDDTTIATSAWSCTNLSYVAPALNTTVGGELFNAMALLNSSMGADTDPIENLLISVRQGVSNASALALALPPIKEDGENKEEESTKEIYEDPIEKRIRYREYKVTELNPTPWKRNFAFPNFEAEILTVVASVSLAVDLDLKRIAERARNVEYNPKRFASLIMRIREPKSAALIFSSGKMVVAGTKSEEECRSAVRKYARVIQRIGYRVSMVNLEIQNISASGHLRFGVRVHEMARDEKVKQFVSYEAEIFPGLIYSLVKPKVKAIIFVTGAILMTGAKSAGEIQEALETIYPIARKHRR